jgi:hypothetical protein
VNVHGWIAEQNPSAANIVVGGAGFATQNEQAERVAGMSGKFRENALVHGGLRRLLGKTGRSPDGDGATILGKKERFGETIRVDILEEAVEAVHQEVDGQAPAVGECSGVIGIEEVDEGPLLFGAVALIIDKERAVIESGE